ncbi:uncharacterized protein LOC134237900 [Saccostrea cucullata]|uniref:uncharacterized protein LOC134237900 n=1 Tax=Saccostrea cuccullata TaxID=36930 RepID=UPI002ED2B50D
MEPYSQLSVSDIAIIITSVVVSALLLFLGSLVMFLIIRKTCRAAEHSVKEGQSINLNVSGTSTGEETIDSTYTELGTLDKPNTYDVLRPNVNSEIPHVDFAYTELGTLESPNTYEALHRYVNVDEMCE